jgi:selenide,water dikinase
MEDILHDPQTSGGLLVSVRADLADKLVEDMKKNGSIEAKIIGNVIDKKDSYIKVK